MSRFPTDILALIQSYCPVPLDAPSCIQLGRRERLTVLREWVRGIKSTSEIPGDIDDWELDELWTMFVNAGENGYPLPEYLYDYYGEFKRHLARYFRQSCYEFEGDTELSDIKTLIENTQLNLAEFDIVTVNCKSYLYRRGEFLEMKRHAYLYIVPSTVCITELPSILYLDPKVVYQASIRLDGITKIVGFEEIGLMTQYSNGYVCVFNNMLSDYPLGWRTEKINIRDVNDSTTRSRCTQLGYNGNRYFTLPSRHLRG